jgi:hypothetical protein
MGLAVSLSDFVVRVYLDGEVLTCVNELDKQGKLVAEALIVLFAYETSFLFAYQLVKTLAFVFAVGHNGLVAFDARDFPTLADSLHLGV